MKRRAFTIIELLVAMALTVVLLGITAYVFQIAVQAYRTAAATSEIMRKYQALTQQLKIDLQGLQKNAEFAIVWAPAPVIKKNPPGIAVDVTGDGVADYYKLDDDNNGIPDRYESFDRLYFFSDGAYQTIYQQPTLYSNLSRICWIFGRNGQKFAGDRAFMEPDSSKRMLCRTQHLLTGDTSLTPFPDFSLGWVEEDFNNQNFTLEYQTMSLQNWLDLDKSIYKPEMLSKILDLRVGTSVATEGGPIVNLQNPAGLNMFFAEGVGQFHVQIWDSGNQKWFPEIDPNFDGDYSDTDTFSSTGLKGYTISGNDLDLQFLGGAYWIQDEAGMQAVIGDAFKFTFTLYDSRGIFPEGKTFTYIVYLN